VARRRTAVLISGRGSNMAALIAAAADPAYPAEIALVLSSRAGAAGLDKAQAAGVKAEAIDHAASGGAEAFEAAIEARLAEAGIELVCLAGFMRLLSAGFVDHWRDRLINIHPSLLPAFAGLNTHHRALEAGVRVHGCTVHFVRAAMDDGPIIAQAAVPVIPADTPETLAARVLAAEHVLYPWALALVAAERVRVVNELVVFEDTPPGAGGPAVLYSPAPPKPARPKRKRSRRRRPS
jgi:phosphoribosylglycinamide formyltransferase-1